MYSAEEKRIGFIAAASAYLFWGLLPLYFKLVGFASAWEILAQRVLWCVPAAFLAMLFMGGSKQTLAAVSRPGVLPALALSSVLIAANWTLYVYAVAAQHVIEASLAYFLSPLVSVLFGVLFFKETLTRAQGAALALAGVGVALEALALGEIPWIALAICFSWCTYVLVRKKAPVPAAGGLLAETLILAPVAALALFVIAGRPGGLAFGDAPLGSVYLALSGAATATPLILFNLGAQRLSFATLGLLQFAAPTIQFIIGALYGEPVTPLRLAGFGLIWAGLIAFSWDSIARERARLSLHRQQERTSAAE